MKIRKLLIASVLLFSTPFCYSMSFSHAKAIYNKVVRANHVVFAPKLVLNPSSQVNAHAKGLSIEINRGLLNYMRSDSEIALVLGHELAHVTLHHLGSNYKNEFAADKLGAHYMQHAGYNKCSGAKYFYRMNHGKGDTHPADKDRAHKIGC